MGTTALARRRVRAMVRKRASRPRQCSRPSRNSRQFLLYRFLTPYGFQTKVATEPAGRVVVTVFPWKPMRSSWPVVPVFRV